MGGKRIHVTTGQQHNRLTVIKEVPSYRQPNGRIKRRVLCKCDCGNETTVNLDQLRNNHTQSCGCLQKESAANSGRNSATHRLSQSKEYRIWNAIKQRCNNSNDGYYYLYGKQGVAICQRWQDSFQAFIDDMGLRPSDKHSIDRYPDRDGPYSPDNCRWATWKEQQRNRRNNVMLTIGDETMCVAAWAEKMGVKSQMIRDRLNTGWTARDAVMVPKGGRRTL